MISRLKRFFYFPAASYFKFFASIQLKFWGPRIIVITGSSGKTTLLHLLRSQLAGKARYSDKANSSFGIPFDILDLKRKSLKINEWIGLFLLAPFRAFKKIPAEKLYIVEADCDRVGEGKFLAEFLSPEVSCLLNISRTHSINFEGAVESGGFQSVDEAIAYEFGYFLENSKKLALVNGDSDLVNTQLRRVKCPLIKVSRKKLSDYRVTLNKSVFEIDESVVTFNCLLPEETFYGIYMCLAVLDYLGEGADLTFSKFTLPLGRSSVFNGIKDTILIDSSYNASLESMRAVLAMFDKIAKKLRWVVLSDMTEQGSVEGEEHESLADEILKYDFDRIILMGPRMEKIVYPILSLKVGVLHFLTPKEVLDYLGQNLKGGETILFKGARFLEGVIEHLLKNKEDTKKLCRRELAWQERRERWGL